MNDVQIKWISVKDRLPDIGIDVYVVRAQDNKVIPAIYEHWYGNDAFVYDAWGKSCDCCEEYYWSDMDIKDAIYWIKREDLLKGLILECSSVK